MQLTSLVALSIAASGLLMTPPLRAQQADATRHHQTQHPEIKSFVVDERDISLTYPGYLAGRDLPDEHTTVQPHSTWDGQPSYLLFATSSIEAGGAAGAVVLQTDDLIHFYSAGHLGYAEQVMSSPVPFTTCDGLHNDEFDENYAGPGSVVEDPTLPPGHLIMLYEAENHCPGGVNQTSFYATIGFARSSDGGRTWPAPVNSSHGSALRHPALKAAIAQPSTPYAPGIGDAIPSALVDIDDSGQALLYVAYTYHDGSNGAAGVSIRMARAELGERHRFDDHRPNEGAPVPFLKWYNGAYSQAGIGGLDTAILPTTACLGQARMPDLTYNDDLGLYLLVFVCSPSAVSNGQSSGAWYFSTATSLELQDWSTPRLIIGSQRPYGDCTDKSGIGSTFDGFYASLMSPGAAQGHTRLTGRAFFLDGCDHSTQRKLASRAYRIDEER